MGKKEDTTALDVANTSGLALQVSGWDEIEAIGNAFAKSQFFGEITSSTGALIAMTCIDEHISPVQFIRRYHIINGTPSVKTRELVRRFKQFGGKMKLHEVTEEVCDITFSYDGNEIRNKVTMEQFKENGVAIGAKGMKDNWRKFPADMLYARCCAPSIRKVCPEADDGLYVAEEQQDIADERFSTPKEVAVDDVKSRLAKMSSANNNAEPPVATPDVVIADCNEPSLCPIAGRFFGVKWTEMDIDVLQAARNQRDKHPELTDAHIEAIENAVMQKEASNG